MSADQEGRGIFGRLLRLFRNDSGDSNERSMRGNPDDRQMRGNPDDRQMRGNPDDR